MCITLRTNTEFPIIPAQGVFVLFKMAFMDFPATVFVNTVAVFIIMAMTLNGGDNAIMDIG